MKLFDQNTSEIVAAAAAVLEGKVDEAALSAKKKLKEVEEPEAQGEKDFKAKHAVKKVGRTGEDDDVTVDEEQDVCESCGKVHEGACSEELDEATMSGKEKKAYEDGRKAALSGKEYKSNPYDARKDGAKMKLAWSKGHNDVRWDMAFGEGALDEVTIHVTEAKLKAGRGNAKIDVDYMGNKVDAYDAGKKFKIKIAVGRNDDAIITGEKKNIIAYLQSDYYGMDDQDIEELFPELMESLTEAKIKGTYLVHIVGRGMGQLDITKYIRKQLGKKAGDIYFDGADLVYNDRTVVRGALRDQKMTVDDLLAAVKKAAGIKEESDKQKKYQAFFQKALKKFGVDSPQDLEKDKRAEFFDYVDANYEADNETD